MSEFWRGFLDGAGITIGFIWLAAWWLNLLKRRAMSEDAGD